ncbi:hypothetical protein JGH11_07395 [Dysgonomonas sp. Marseille-P4677]|uniref:hypothetical protein n=1 Tax=Dysgonomonas sp. Marseille-P4677 TaxID=2364790 RepID=UPI001911732F|nr:hypothetical protein [Dysgonomonas sp. Marseille-P4677]MBK5720694.1 hypothetical protein [Dysgonomonas sp. Marseille-P4677]
MRKTLLLLLISVFALCANAQTVDYENYYKGIESYGDLYLSSDQISKIKELQRSVGPKFAAIGKDRSLSGYEKGQRKRELALKHRAQIRSILNANQINTLEKKYGTIHEGDRIKDVISDSYDDKLDALEKKFEAEEDAIDDNPYLSKAEKKARIKTLKYNYKKEKENLKNQKKATKNGLFR